MLRPFYPRKKCTFTHSIGHWIGHRPCLNTLEEKKNLLSLPGIENDQTPFWFLTFEMGFAYSHLKNEKPSKEKFDTFYMAQFPVTHITLN